MFHIHPIRTKAYKNPDKLPKVGFREKAKLPVSAKKRNDYADYDYLDQLSPEELAWLKKFHNEWVQASFTKNPLNKNKKEIYDANNARNRCLYNTMKWLHLLDVERDMDFARDWMKLY